VMWRPSLAPPPSKILKLWLRVNYVQSVGLRAAVESASAFTRPVAARMPGILGRYALQRHALDRTSRPQTAFGDPSSQNKNSLQRGRGRVYAPYGLRQGHPQLTPREQEVPELFHGTRVRLLR
jgi:hypothetical protein